MDDSRLTLGVGQRTRLSDGSQLSYTRLINDSRSARDIRLHSSPQGGATNIRIGDRTLTLVSLERGIAPKATLSLTPVP